MRTLSPSVRLTTLLVGATLAGVSAAGATARSIVLAQPPFKKPALVAVSGRTGGLEAWLINPVGSSKPRNVSAPLGLGYAPLVANGDVVFAAMESPAQVLVYKVKTKNQTAISDPFGTPVDIAIGKDTSLYLVNIAKPHGNVAWYPKGSSQAQELTCKYIDFGESIAVDNEGDIFVQGYEVGSITGVIEIPNGPSGPQSGNCRRLRLQSEDGTYTAGVAIDPKTDALITLDNPDLCAGGDEGRMTVYPKPYRARTSSSVILGGNCTGGLRLNADSTIVFYGDETVSGGSTFIDSSTYPAGQSLGKYSEGNIYSGTSSGGFTTIPNSLPN